MKIRKSGGGVMLMTALAVLWWITLASAASDPPRLVLQITVDQLRGDLPGRYADRLTEGGFRYLMEKGTWYIDAHYQHANTETAVGHATLVTGADPSRHGIVANDWINQKPVRSFTIQRMNTTTSSGESPKHTKGFLRAT
jgi:predicted AlkP superfamily pyrophosphatase or phosphodiesterase